MLKEERWVGGANLPTCWGSRVNATSGLAELRLSGSTITLRLRGPLRRLTGGETLTATATDVESVFPIRSTFRLARFCFLNPFRFRGVAFRTPDGREYYFKTREIDEIV